ncbi:MAG: hypothetical protein GY928_20735 [Colwellia sp.]|nr:hypothetical protein [Colwellia sp.]
MKKIEGKKLEFEKREFAVMLLCLFLLGLLFGNMWGSSATRNTIFLNLEHKVNNFESYLGEKISVVEDDLARLKMLTRVLEPARNGRD